MIKKLLLIVLGMVFGEITILAQSDEEVKKGMMVRQEAQYKRVLESPNATNISSKMNISGIIIDDNGNPLNDVELEFNFSRAKGWESESLNKKVVSKSRFSFTQSGYTGVTVYFRKKGYFSETRFYGTYQASKYLKNKTYTQTDEKIVLREKGKFAKIDIFDKKLKYSFSKKTKGICDVSNLSYETFPIDKKIDCSKYIYLDFERNQDGEIIMTQNHLGHLIPKGPIVRYFSKDSNDGFILVEPPKDITYLTTAPDTAYNIKEIKIPYGIDRIYFYYRNGKSYGKGFVGYANSAFQESRVTLYLMQNNENDPNEKYNLRSDER